LPRLPTSPARLIPAALAAAAALLVAAGCVGPQPRTAPVVPQPRVEAPPPVPPAPSGPAVVGLLLPLSGSGAKLGADFLDAAQLALFDVGGDALLELVPRDTGDSPEGAVTAAHAAVDGGAQLLLGPLFGRSTAAVAPVAAARRVAVLSFSNDASVARPGVYVLGFRPEEQVARVAEFAGRRGLSRFAALAPDDAYGALAADSLRRSVGRVPGASVVGIERYPVRQGQDPTPAMRRLAGLGGRPVDPDAVPGSGATAAASAPFAFDALLVAGRRAAAALGRGEPRLLRRRPGADPAARHVALAAGRPGGPDEPALQGAWLATWSPGAVDGFTRRFRSAYGRAPLPLAVLAYDATALAALLAKGADGFGPDQLTDPQGFTGGSGLFRLRRDGLAEHGLAVLEVRNGVTRLVDPAPTSFPGGLASR
jgi:ABC-type branched-subunit amino acid transport system substrate-binding protein